jgi:hypothetical protein
MSTGITDVEWLDAKVCELADEISRLHKINAELIEALELIAETDHIDAAIDPQRAVRVAKTAIARARGL